MLDASFLGSLEEIVGQTHICTDPVELYAYSMDASFRVAVPGVVVKPGDVREVQAIVNLCRDAGVSITARGAASSFAGQALNLTGGLVMDMRRMDQVLEVSIGDQLVRVQPGINYDQLNRLLRANGFYFPPEPGSAEMCTVGGMVANNASGLGSVKYGSTRHHVLALEVVLADGSIIHTGSRCVKSASTYDLTQLLVGSEGTLGVITEITLKITPVPRFHDTFIVSFDDLRAAAECALEIQKQGIVPSAMELVGGFTLSMVRDAFAEPFPESVYQDKGAILIIEVSGSSAAGVKNEGAVIESICRDRALTLRHAQDETERGNIWHARHAFGAKLSKLRGAQSVNIPVMDIIVPLSKIPDTVERIYQLTKQEGMPTQATYYGHIGDGNLHVNTMYNPDVPKTMEMSEKFTRAVIKIVQEVGGVISAEHGVGFVKAPYIVSMVDTLPAMRAIKRALDPTNLFNPGQMGLDWDPFEEKPVDQFIFTIQDYVKHQKEGDQE